MTMVQKDLSSTPARDLSPVPPDLTPPPPPCAHGQDRVGGVCQCLAQDVACGGAVAYCCDSSQQCLAAGADSAERCSPPSPRWYHAMAYDPVRNRTVLFGGQDDNLNPLGDLWELDSFTWNPQQPATGPSARQNAAIAFDGVRNKILLFSGQGLQNNKAAFPADTWTWDGTAWAELSPAQAPAGRSQGRMVWDSGRKVVVLFGGTTADGVSQSDTWEWNGTTWLQRQLATSPAAREGHAMAYDAQHQKTVLFGGLANGTTESFDTWLYDGTSWVQQTLTAAQSPPARDNHAMAYDPVRQRVVLFAGEAGSGYLDDTWEWDGAAWAKKTPVAPAPSPIQRFEHAMVYDVNRQAVVLFAGHTRTAAGVEDSSNDAWTWNGTAWTQIY